MTAAATVASVRARKGTQREYECVLILRSETNKTGIMDLIGRINGILEREGARMTKVENWGLRTLAYPIAHSKRGIYLYLRFLGGSATVTELERNLRITETVIRYLTVKIDEDVDPEARPDDLDAEALEAAGDTAPDPVEIARQREEEERAAAEAARKAEEEAAAAAAAAGEAAAEGGESTEAAPSTEEGKE